MPWAHRYVAENSSSANKRAEIRLLATKRWRAHNPDNLKSGVHRWHRYDPDLNQAYAEFAEYYGVAILPARRKKPRDKAKVETGVGFVERFILARLRNHQFFI